MDAQEKTRLVLEQVTETDGKQTMPCAAAFRVHREHGIALAEIGRICNENGVRIRNCQLGCFK
ncbi:MAG: hypothetical protein JSW27_04530 [Phycisphaerales bacterium]|nr:MAG: hypothetical protein JSW27_04530 [Phycisphaerales bacterium]